MATLRQKRVARKIPKIIAEGKPITGGELVASVGYGEDMQRKPGEVLNSLGVQDELGKLGFTEEKAKEVVAVILGDTSLNPEPRLKAADMVFKSFGTYAPEKHLTVNVEVNPSEDIEQFANALLHQQRNT